MNIKRILFYVFAITSIFLSATNSNAQTVDEKEHIEIALRMIGHQILLNCGNDSTSRVLPIVVKNNQYKIEFETEFELNTTTLVATIDKVVKETRLAKSYIATIEDCTTNKVVYGFEMNDAEESNIIPCGGRVYPKACYHLLFTILEGNDSESSQKTSGRLFYGLIALGMLTLLLLLLLWKKKHKKSVNSTLVVLGNYQFDSNSGILLIQGQKTQLTSKESELLLLLYANANTTIERETILKVVWGDDGDYVGRTLDVFISKLRKKLELDSSVKIANIRGIGYKLILEM